MSVTPIKSALISVYYKDGLDSLVKALHAHGVEIYSTGGTQSFIEQLGIPVNTVEGLTGYASILGGRVKTLHPKVFGGILARREEMNDINDLAAYDIPTIDLVIVDLYPFEETVASGAAHQDIIEKIDIGGISLIRAGAKNYKEVAIISSKDQYGRLLAQVEAAGGTTAEERARYAAEAFAVSSHYDSQIFNYFNQSEKLPALRITSNQPLPLRYGENPHQAGNFFGDLDDIFEILNGKQLSYNNLLDVDAAVNLLADFDEPTFAVIKHNNACGLASRPTVLEAWKDALAGDPVSAFGGILMTNGTIDLETASEIDQIFYEVLIAPAYTDEAIALLKKKKNRILVRMKKAVNHQANLRTVLNGVLQQEKDSFIDSRDNLKIVTQTTPSEAEIEDMIFAAKLVKHTKSNAIVLAKNKQLIGSGTGQTSRIDAMKQAVHKARSFNFDVHGAVLASDAFFPFADSVEVAYNEGIRAVIQPGGSIKDQDSIDFCNTHGMSMVFTGIRHFKH
ncbi:MAG: bifunctional phosphoribosylaminoimidazolecarboxamide formyltransferase/IMP cyclohydrolase [Bacteroidia bacterium]